MPEVAICGTTHARRKQGAETPSLIDVLPILLDGNGGKWLNIHTKRSLRGTCRAARAILRERLVCAALQPGDMHAARRILGSSTITSSQAVCAPLRHIIYTTKGDHASISCLTVLHFPNLYRLKVTCVHPCLLTNCLNILASANTWPRLARLEMDIGDYFNLEEDSVLDFSALGRCSWPLEKFQVWLRHRPDRRPPKVTPVNALLAALPCLRQVEIKSTGGMLCSCRA